MNLFNILADPFISHQDTRIQDLFKYYDKSKKGYIDLNDFLEFYENASWIHENTVWNNLRILGYSPDLSKVEFAKKSAITHSLNYQKLPRFILSNNEKNFEFLVSLLGLGGEVADAVWHLMFRLAPPERLESNLLNLFSEKGPTFDELFSETHHYQSVIALYLAETFISDASTPEILEIRKEPRDELRVLWKTKFAKNAGLTWTINVRIFKYQNNK